MLSATLLNMVPAGFVLLASFGHYFGVLVRMMR